MGRWYPNELDSVGILFDFGNVKAIKELLDHKTLNAIPELIDINPTTENLTMFIYKYVKTLKPNLDFTIRLYETSLGKITYAEYGDFKI